MDKLSDDGAEQYHFIMAIAMCGQAVHEQHRQGCLSGVAHGDDKQQSQDMDIMHKCWQGDFGYAADDSPEPILQAGLFVA